MATSTENYNIRRFDRTAGVPQSPTIAPDMSAANKWQGLADAINTLSDKGGGAYKAKLAQEERAELRKRRDEAYARQQKKIKEDEDRIEAELLYNQSGGKSWHELNEEEKDFQVENTKMGMQAPGVGKLPLTKDQKESQGLKEAYQLRRTDAVLEKQQADWDQVAPNLADKVYDEWLDQKDDPDGVQNLTEYATVKLQGYKAERFQENIAGNPMLKKALAQRPPTDDKYLSMIAKRKQEYLDEVQDKTIQAGIDSNAKFDLSTPDGIDALRDDIYLAEGKGGKVKVFDRDRVSLQMIDHLDRGVDDATSSDAPVFESLDAFRGKNYKKGRAFFDRRRGIGEAWNAWYTKALTKKAQLMKAEKSAGEANIKVKKEAAKVSSNGHLMTAGQALQYSTASKKGAFLNKETLQVEGEPTKLQVLQNAILHLDANQQTFEDAQMANEWLEKRAELTAQINKIDPSHHEFEAPASDEAVALKKKYREELSTLSSAQVREKIQEEAQNITQLPWVVNMKKELHEERLSQLDGERKEIKDQQAITKSDLEIENKKNTKKSSKKKIKTRLDMYGKNSTQLTQMMTDVGKDDDFVNPDKNSLITELQTNIKTAKENEGRQKDNKQFTGFFKRVTGTKGKLPTTEELETLEGEVNNYEWTNESQKNQITTLIAAGKKGEAEFLIAKEAIVKENQYRDRLNKATTPVKKKMAELIDKVKSKDKVGADAITDLKELQDNFLENNKDLIEEGEQFKSKVNHEDMFNDAYASILGERTELQLAEEKKQLVLDSKKNQELREDKKAGLILEVREMALDPTFLQDEGQVSDLITRIKTASEREIFEDGNILPSSNILTPTEQGNLVRDLEVAVKDTKDPTKSVTNGQTMVETYNKRVAIEGAPPSKKGQLIDEARIYLKQQYLADNLNTADFKSEQSKLEEVASHGKVKTKTAYTIGEDSIKLMFSGTMDKYINNEKYLPNNEQGILYSDLAKVYYTKWNGMLKELEEADELTKSSAAIKLADSLTQVYENNGDHPAGKDVNIRLREYGMKRQDLRKLRDLEKKTKQKGLTLQEQEALVEKQATEKFKEEGELEKQMKQEGKSINLSEKVTKPGIVETAMDDDEGAELLSWLGATYETMGSLITGEDIRFRPIVTN